MRRSKRRGERLSRIVGYGRFQYLAFDMEHRYVSEGIEGACPWSTNAQKRSDVTVDRGEEHRKHSTYHGGQSGYERA